MKRDAPGIGRRGFVGLSVASAAATLPLARPALAQGARPRTWRFGSPMPTNSNYHQAMVIFADEMAKLSNNRIKVELYPAGQLGGLKDMLTSVQLGTQTMLITVPAWFSSFVHPMDVFTLPFIVGSPQQLRAALDGPFGQRMSGWCSAAGFQPLGWWLTGPRHMLNNVRPIHLPADMAGIKLRVIASQVYIETFRMLGANPVALDTSEVYLGLQQHAIDGLENPYPDIVVNKYYEVAKYLSTTGHVVDFFIAAMNQQLWEGLPPAEKDMVKQAMKTASDWQWAEQPRSLDEAYGKLRSVLQVNETTPDERAAFVKATRPVYQKFEASIGKDVIEQAIQALS